MKKRFLVIMATVAALGMSSTLPAYASEAKFEDVYNLMVEKSEDIDSMKADATLDFAMSIKDASGETNLPVKVQADFDIVAHNHGNGMVKGNVAMNIMGQTQEIPVEAYIDMTGDKVVTYAYDAESGQWAATESEMLSTEKITDEEAKEQLNKYIDVEDEDSIYVLHFGMDKETLEKLSGQDMSADEMGIDLSGVRADFFANINKEDGSLINAYGSIKSENGPLDFSTVTGAEGMVCDLEVAEFNMNVSQVNGVEAVEIPAEALAAKETEGGIMDILPGEAVGLFGGNDEPDETPDEDITEESKDYIHSDRWNTDITFTPFDKLEEINVDGKYMYVSSKNYEYGYPGASVYVYDDDFYEEGDGKEEIKSSRDYTKEFYSGDEYEDVEVTDVFEGEMPSGQKMYGYMYTYKDKEFEYISKTYQVAIEMDGGGYIMIEANSLRNSDEDEDYLTDDFANEVINAVKF